MSRKGVLFANNLSRKVSCLRAEAFLFAGRYTYCSEMNLIESQWNQLKTHEIAGRMFDNEYDLAMAVIDGMKARSEVNEYALERFIFNCT